MADPAPLDGRHQRSARSRAAVVEAALELIRERGEQPSAQEIADRAGVSLRTVFRHHDDMDSLLAEALASQMQRVGHLFGRLQPMPVEDFVAHRRRLYEDITNVRRAALIHGNREVIRGGLADAHRRLRHQLQTVFEVDGDTLEALDAVTSWAAWDEMRREQGLSGEEAERVVAHAIRRLIDP
jgi:AcrR family transcriptional regulator